MRYVLISLLIPIFIAGFLFAFIKSAFLGGMDLQNDFLFHVEDSWWF